MLNRVTITGADDQTPISALIELSARFPWVEWGILASKSQEGGARFPSRMWQRQFFKDIPASVNVSMHLCGRWVRELLIGKLNGFEIPDELFLRAGRVQINTHAEQHLSTVGFYDQLEQFSARPTPIQWVFHGVNDHLLEACEYRTFFCGSNLNVTGLFDLSHGAGVLPNQWPKSEHDYRVYAGGLGPENVESQIRIIEPLCAEHFWIDMEGRVRTDEVLDLAKVQAVLEAAEPFINRYTE